MLMFSHCCSQISGVELDVVTDEGLHKVVVVAISCLHSEVQRVFGLGAGCDEVLGSELVVCCGNKSIVRALIDQDWCLWSRVGSHELGGIVCFASLDASEIAGEGLDSPVALSWIADGCESGYRLVQSWVLEVE